MKKIVLIFVSVFSLSFLLAFYFLWHGNYLFVRLNPKVITVNGAESKNCDVYKSVNGDYLVFLSGSDGRHKTFVVYNSEQLVGRASRLNWSFGTHWFVIAPDTVTGTVVAGMFQDKLSGHLSLISQEQLVFQAGDTFVDIHF